MQEGDCEGVMVCISKGMTVVSSSYMLLPAQVVTMDTELLHHILEEGFHPLTLPPSILRAGIRRLCCQGSAVPVLCGSAQRNVGVQPLMDAMVELLPGPGQACM